MANPAVPAIFEAAFTFEDIRIRVGILDLNVKSYRIEQARKHRKNPEETTSSSIT